MALLVGGGERLTINVSSFTTFHTFYTFYTGCGCGGVYTGRAGGQEKTPADPAGVVRLRENLLRQALDQLHRLLVAELFTDGQRHHVGGTLVVKRDVLHRAFGVPVHHQL